MIVLKLLKSRNIPLFRTMIKIPRFCYFSKVLFCTHLNNDLEDRQVGFNIHAQLSA